MKKLYLLLSSTALSLLVAGSLATTVAGCDHKKKDDKTTKVCDALKKFTETNPIEIPYNTANPTAPASDPTVTKAIRDQLKAKNPIFTAEVVAGITFSNTALQVNRAVQVVATYNEKATTIYVKEPKNPGQGIYDALEKFNQTNPIEIPYNTANPTAPASDPTVTKAIRDQLKAKNPIFTAEVVAGITFSNTALQVNRAVQVVATYNEKATTIYVKEPKNPGQGIYDALEKFNQTNPIEIPYNTANPTAPASDPKVTKAIKDQLKSKNPIFTDPVVAGITFSNTALQVNTAVSIQATYKNKATPIYVKELKNPGQGIYDALEKFNQTNPIEIPYNTANPTAPASDPKVTKAIKDQLKSKNPIFTDPVVAGITFSKTALQPETAVEIQAIYKNKSTPIYVKEQDLAGIKRVIDALNEFNNPDNAVEIDAKYAGKYADEYSF